MKVPIRYKSSDRYNAGVDVVYDDESKLQYAPFVYATTASGDNGDDSEDEDEGMVVTIKSDDTLGGYIGDKTFDEIANAMTAGKNVVFVWGEEAMPVIHIQTAINQLRVMMINGTTSVFTKDDNTGYPFQSAGD